MISLSLYVPSFTIIVSSIDELSIANCIDYHGVTIICVMSDYPMKL